MSLGTVSEIILHFGSSEILEDTKKDSVGDTESQCANGHQNRPEFVCYIIAFEVWRDWMGVCAHLEWTYMGKWMNKWQRKHMDSYTLKYQGYHSQHDNSWD